MLLKLKDAVENLSNLKMEIDFAEHHTRIRLSGPQDSEGNTIPVGNEAMYGVLCEMMPGTRISDISGDNIGHAHKDVHTYCKYLNKVRLFDGFLENGEMHIVETEFNSHLEFYLYMFNHFENVVLYNHDLHHEGIDSPFHIIHHSIEKTGYHIKGFRSIIASEHEDYSYATLVLEQENGNEWLFHYPQKDPFNKFHEFLPIQKTTFHSYSTDLLGLMLRINDDTLKEYLEDTGYASNETQLSAHG
jgi:hypothetical protein